MPTEELADALRAGQHMRLDIDEVFLLREYLSNDERRKLNFSPADEDGFMKVWLTEDAVQ